MHTHQVIIVEIKFYPGKIMIILYKVFEYYQHEKMFLF